MSDILILEWNSPLKAIIKMQFLFKDEVPGQGQIARCLFLGGWQVIRGWTFSGSFSCFPPDRKWQPSSKWKKWCLHNDLDPESKKSSRSQITDRVLLPSKRKLFCIKNTLPAACLLSNNKGLSLSLSLARACMCFFFFFLIRGPLTRELHLLQRNTLISIWSVSKNPTRRSMIEARWRPCGGVSRAPPFLPQGAARALKNSPTGRDLEQIAGGRVGGVESKCAAATLSFWKVQGMSYFSLMYLARV